MSGLVVLDVDGPEGEATFRRLLDEHVLHQHGDQVAALWARTGSGGWHAYMRHPGCPISNSAGKLGPGLDVRGDGGYVIAPPSMHTSAGRYEWHGAGPRRPLPPMPVWLVEMLTQPAPPDRRPVQVTTRGLSPYVLAAIEGEARDVAEAPEGQRNVRLHSAAVKLGTLVGAGAASEVDVTDILLIAARTAGLPDRAASATIRSGLEYGRAHPREVT